MVHSLARILLSQTTLLFAISNYIVFVNNLFVAQYSLRSCLIERTPSNVAHFFQQNRIMVNEAELNIYAKRIQQSLISEERNNEPGNQLSKKKKT